MQLGSGIKMHPFFILYIGSFPGGSREREINDISGFQRVDGISPALKIAYNSKTKICTGTHLT